MLDPQNWPRLPKGKSRPVYVNYNLSEPDALALVEKGWTVVDIRLLPCDTLTERQTIVLAWLEGLRQGTLDPPPKLLDFLDLEAKLTGLNAGRAAPTDAPTIDKQTLDQMLDFRSSRETKVFTPGAVAGKAPGQKLARPRPKRVKSDPVPVVPPGGNNGN